MNRIHLRFRRRTCQRCILTKFTLPGLQWNLLTTKFLTREPIPTLGKLIQAVGVAVVGATPFGWRIMGVIFGTLIVAVMYLLGKKLFGTWIGGFSAAFLMTFDFMHFTMARIGTVDTYVIFFSLLSQLFFLIYFMKVLKVGWKKTSVLPLFLAVVFFSLGFLHKVWVSAFSQRWVYLHCLRQFG